MMLKRSCFIIVHGMIRKLIFVLREGPRILRLVQVCYDMSSPKTEKQEMDSIVECAGELKCDNLVIVTYNDKRTIEKDGYRVNVVPITEFRIYGYPDAFQKYRRIDQNALT